MSSLRIAIVGATGVVGQEMEKILLEDDAFKDAQIDLYASTERKGTKHIMALSNSWDKIAEANYILGASDATVAGEIASKLKPGQVLIDNSSAFRADPKYPLVVPEINAHLLKDKPAVVANPNCTAILLCMTLAPLQKKYGLKRVIVSTYQAASGAGLKGLEELESQIQHYASQKFVGGSTSTFGHPLFLNIMSHNSAVRTGTTDGLHYNDEEWKVLTETRKILDLPKLAISATCMRVPVKRAHTESVSVDLENDFSETEVLGLFGKSAGLNVVNDVEKNHFPMPLEATDQDQVLVGRVRKDAFLENTLHYILAGDQLRKGAATNAIQILKTMAF